MSGHNRKGQASMVQWKTREEHSRDKGQGNETLLCPFALRSSSQNLEVSASKKGKENGIEYSVMKLSKDCFIN